MRAEERGSLNVIYRNRPIGALAIGHSQNSFAQRAVRAASSMPAMGRHCYGQKDSA